MAKEVARKLIEDNHGREMATAVKRRRCRRRSLHLAIKLAEANTDGFVDRLIHGEPIFGRQLREPEAKNFIYPGHGGIIARLKWHARHGAQ
jgi:hypothetical protein